IHYDELQTWGVVGVRHVLENGSGRTFLTTRGAPAGGHRRWLNLSGTGRRTTPGSWPNPTIDELWGESAAAGEGGDGGVWIRVRFDAGTEAIRFYSETGAALPLPMPGQDANTLAMELKRVEGDAGSAED